MVFDEELVTKWFYQKKIDIHTYHKLLSKIAERRNIEKIEEKKFRMNMSSTKWL